MAVFRKVDRYIFARLNLHWIQDNETVSELPEDVEFVTRVNDEHCQLICKNSALNLNEMYLWKKICRTHQLGRKFIAFISLLSKTIALLGYFKKLIIRKLIPTSTQMNFCNPSLQVNKRKMRLNKIPDDVLWKEEIGKSGYTAYFVASCKNQGEKFYSRNDLLIFWHKTSVNVARRENTVILDILLQKYNVCGFIHAKHIHNKWSSSHNLAFVLMMHSPWITACIRVPGILEAARIQSWNDSW